MFSTKFRLLCYSALIVSALSSSAWADNADLSRTVPVPSTQKIPTADFFRGPLLWDPEMSPDGKHIAALITTAGDHAGMLCYDLETQKYETISLAGERDIYEFGWLGDKRLFFFVSTQKLYGMGVYGVTIGNFDRPFPLLQYQGASIIGIPPKNRTYPLIWAQYDNFNENRDAGVVVVNSNLENGKGVDLTGIRADRDSAREADEENQRHITFRYPVAPGGLGQWYYTARAGNLEFAITADKGRESLFRLEGGSWIPVPADLDELDFITTGNTPGEALVNGPRQPGKPRAVQWLDGKTGKLGEVLFQEEGYDFNGYLYRDPVSQAVVGAVYDTNGPHVRWFTEEYNNLQKLLNGFFPGLVVRLLGSDDLGKTFLVGVRSDRQPTIYYSVNLESKKVGLIKKSSPWIDPARMQPMNIIKYKTRDGRKVDAYLTLPAGANKSAPPPLVVFAHGGPWVRDTWGFDGYAQFFASRGYAVLQPNYRGSTGYDWMFPIEDKWDFVKMSQDVTDATKAMIASGLVDGKRVAIMGGSFGGYLALSGAVNEPDLYKCAVTLAGVFDWEAMINDKKYDQYGSFVYGYYLRHIGDPAKQKEKFDAISPLRHVDRVKIPIFVSHGTEDSRVDVGESRKLIHELEKYKVPHEVMIARGEGHGMHRIVNQVEYVDRAEAFLAKYLSPSAPAALPVSTAGATK